MLGKSVCGLFAWKKKNLPIYWVYKSETNGIGTGFKNQFVSSLNKHVYQTDID